ncbi:ATPase [Clostridium saccharoperbutylacetonicum]|uniref:ATPase n=1 Tax=Clostridium saccharoperbutylacetonicum TaxID=36745 RepID=UPI0039E86A74
MKDIKFDIEETEICFMSLAYMFSNLEARKEYKSLLQDNRIEYPNNELDIISSIIAKYAEEEKILENFEVVKELIEIQKFSQISDYAFNRASKVYYQAFINKINENIDKLNDIPLISYQDSKQAFISYVGGNLKALINSNTEHKFVKWDSKSWIKITEEESRIIYNDFIQKCEIELKKAISTLEKADYAKVSKKVRSWDNKNRVNEALDKLKRNNDHVINLKYHDKNENVICSKNGMKINLNIGEIKPSCRNDLILNTSRYNLVDRNLAINFMNEKLKIYENVLGRERLKFVLDLIAYKMLGKNLQKAIFMIGLGATGKSSFKNIIKDLFEDSVTNVPYEYFTLNHRGNDDKSRDDLLVSLNNKLWGLSSEGEDDYIISQAKFKTILSNSTETARATRGNLTEINLQKLDLLIDTNTIPKFANFDDAVNRRLLFVRFLNKIPLEKRNSNFYREEIKPNFDYVFSFFVYRAIEMINNELDIPQCIKDDTIQNVKEMDSLLKFSMETIVPMAECYLDCEEVEKAYIKLCDDEDLTNIIPENIIGMAKGYNFLVNKLKDYKGYENIIRDRVSDGKFNKKYIIKGVTFVESDKEDPFKPSKQENFLE